MVEKSDGSDGSHGIAPVERVVMTARGKLPLVAGQHIVEAEPLELVFDREGDEARRWRMVAHVDRRDMLELFRQGRSPVDPVQLLSMDPFRPVRLVLRPDAELAAALDAVQDRRPVVDPRSGIVEPGLKLDLLDLARFAFVEARES